MFQAVRPTLLLACVLTAALSVLLPADADAATALTTATDNCNGALPGYEGALRKRPLGILNEGTANAFVSCGVSINESGNEGINTAAIYLINRGTTTQAVTCTFIDGLPPEFNAISPTLPVATYYPKAVAVMPGQLLPIAWFPADFELETFSPYGAFNCNLPPKMELNIAGVGWTEAAP